MFITVDEAKIYTTAFGPKGRTILGLGGWIGSWELWAEPFSILSQNWHTISYDHRGTGATTAPVESITLDRLVQDVFAVLDAYDVEQCILAAESAGAAVAITAVLQHPHRFSGLVIIDGLYYRPTPSAQDPFFKGLQTSYSQALDTFAQACVPEEANAHIRRWGRQILHRASQESALALYRAMDFVDLREQVKQIVVPVLIIHGSADTILPIQTAYQLAELLPIAQLTIINGANHIPTMTHPQQVAQAITDSFI